MLGKYVDQQPQTNLVQQQHKLDTLKLRALNQNGVTKPSKEEEQKKMLEVAQQFEAIFVKQLLDAMDKTIVRSDLMDGGKAEETFRGMLYQHIADTVSSQPAGKTGNGSGIGLAQEVYKQMARQQESLANTETLKNQTTNNSVNTEGSKQNTRGQTG
ncbi:MAG: rod-binding protein [Vampirovibrio sp.]|nr:rod-binding protein [Vampirovibrio sp.]